MEKTYTIDIGGMIIEFSGIYRPGTGTETEDIQVTGLWFPEGFNPADIKFPPCELLDHDPKYSGASLEQLFLENLDFIEVSGTDLRTHLVEHMAKVI